jgi:hypothetical protein
MAAAPARWLSRARFNPSSSKEACTVSTTRTVELRGQRIEITEAMRAGVVEELPEIAWIEDPALKAKVIDAWAAALASSSFERLGDMKPSGNYDSRPLRHGTQADHIRSVTRLALKTAEEMSGLFPDFRYDRDLLIAGCLCHDIGRCGSSTRRTSGGGRPTPAPPACHRSATPPTGRTSA